MLQQVWDFLTEKLSGFVSGLIPHVSEFWYYYLPIGVAIILVCYLVAKFFDVLRPVAGAVVFATIAFLVGFWKGEKASDEKNAKQIARLKQQRQQKQNTDQWKWW